MSRALEDYTLNELEDQVAGWGFARGHAGRWLRRHYSGGSRAENAALLPPAELRRIFAGLPSPSTVQRRQVAEDGTVKLLLGLQDGRAVESVLMPDHDPGRAAGCLSSQAGCAMGCDFCATGKGGFERNLSAGEIVAQFIALRREALAQGRRLCTVVFMGMGEPMHNLDAVLAAIDRIADNQLGGLGWRQITVSTVGIIAGIDRLAAAGRALNLAVSLHAPDDATRARLLPPGRRFAIADIMAAADRFQAVRGQPVTIQYCLLRGINDSTEHAEALAALLQGRRMHVNLLRYNQTGTGISGTVYLPSPEETAESFAARLHRRRVVAHFRRSRGPDIAAACGQLRAESTA